MTRQQPSVHLEDSIPHHGQHTKEDDGSILTSAGAERLDLDNEIDHGTVIKMCDPLQRDSGHATQPGAEAFLGNNLPTLILERDVCYCKN